MYKFSTDPLSLELTYSLQVGETICYFKADESSPEYQAYLAWVAEGNTAEEWSN